MKTLIKCPNCNSELEIFLISCTVSSNDKNPYIKVFIDGFYNKFLEKTGQKYYVQGAKDGNLVKTMLETYTIDELNELRDAYFVSKDQFILSVGYSIGVFSKVIPKLANEIKERQDIKNQQIKYETFKEKHKECTPIRKEERKDLSPMPPELREQIKKIGKR